MNRSIAPHILIVADDPELCQLISAQLSPAGYLVSSVGSARHADHVIGATKIALAIVDGFLSDRNGETWIAALRKAGNRTLPILFLSFATDAGDVRIEQRLKDLGVAHVMEKPVEPDELQHHVDKLLGGTLSEQYGSQVSRM